MSEAAANILHHYTSQQGMAAIIASRCLWASKITHLNDTTEFLHGVAIAKRLLTKLRDDRIQWLSEYCSLAAESLDRILRINVFVISFSERRDVLSQWRAYSRAGTGYSLGFRRARLEELASRQGFNLHKCIYDPQAQEEKVHEIVTRCIHAFQWKVKMEADKGRRQEQLRPFADDFAFQFAILSPLLKHKAFEEEAEWRLVSLPKSVLEPNYSVRADKALLTPYFVFSLEDQTGRCQIDEIVIGPTPENELTLDGVSGLLSRGYYQNYSISLSQIPFRSP
jgi:hypothetical protein